MKYLRFKTIATRFATTIVNSTVTIELASSITIGFITGHSIMFTFSLKWSSAILAFMFYTGQPVDVEIDPTIRTVTN